MRRNISVLSVIGKMVLYILLFAAVWTIIRWFWLSYDWFPMVKSEIPGICIPLGLSGLLIFLLRHEINSANDKWEGLIFVFVAIASMLIFVNAEIIAEDATAKVVSVDKLTDLSREEIRKANYVQVEEIEPDTSSYNYTTDYYIHAKSRSSDELVFCVYQVCPLKDMEYAFVCSETKGEHNYGFGQSDEKLQRWMSDLEYHMRGTIRYNAMMAHFFKVIHQSDNIEQYMEAASSYLNGVFSNETMRDALSYFPQKGKFLLLLPPLLMIGWGLNMLFNGYTLDGSNNVLFDESGACTPDSLLLEGEWWRIFTSMFVHRDFMHIFGNIMGYALGVFALSNSLYGRDIALVFLISGALSIAFAVLYSQSSVIGASGGVFGLYGAFMSLFIGNLLFGKRRSDGLILLSFVILILLTINIVTSFRSDVSMSGHISGLVSGAIVVWLFRFIYPIFDASYRRYLE